jgi:hypothetical protein
LITALGNFPDSTVACPLGSARKAIVNMEAPISTFGKRLCPTCGVHYNWSSRL